MIESTFQTMWKTAIYNPIPQRRAYDDGSVVWTLDNGQFHRKDGPAIIRANGSREWFLWGARHRLNGPAIEYINGYKAWIVDGRHHNLDGPAIIDPIESSIKWFIKGVQYRDAYEWAEEVLMIQGSEHPSKQQIEQKAQMVLMQSILH